MDTLIEFCKKKWLIQLLGIIALALIIWFFGALSEMARLLVIAIIVVVWLLNNLRIQMQANHATAQMVNGLSAADPQQADQEVALLNNRFTEALQILKKTHSQTAQGNQYLYDLPWYMLIGPPGSGKTTALINSGLEFPLADKFGTGGLQGVGGTRNCDWWFTDQAVLLDTAGRYTTQDSHEAVDKAAWLGFLALLKKYRPRRPLNGLIITMSLADLLKQTEAERLLHAKAIRQRIDELHEQFAIRIPIYMVFTKGDLIAGFTDFFADLGKEERNQVWGVTFPEENQQDTTGILARVTADFDALLARLQTRLLKRLQEERDLQRRALIFGFPQRVALLKDNLHSFLQECYGTNRYQTAPCLRGIYFTSGTQEGTPIDRLMGLLAHTFQLDRVSVPLFSGQGKSYFLTRLLKEVIFAEALLVGVNPRVERVHNLVRHGSYVLALVGIGLMSALWLTSYNKNQTAISAVADKIQLYEKTAITNPPPPDFIELLARMNSMKAVSTVYPRSVPLVMQMGLYQGDKLQPVTEATYHDVLQKQFLPAIRIRLEQSIQNESTHKRDPAILYPLLQVYFMLGGKEELKPGLLSLVMKLEWEKLYPTDVDSKNQLLGHLDQLIKRDFAKNQPLNEDIITMARQILTLTPLSQQIYMDIKNSALQETSALDLKVGTALGTNAGQVFAVKQGSLTQQSVPFLFTYNGFYTVFLKKLKSKDQAQEAQMRLRILGPTAKPDELDTATREQQVLNYYYDDYINVWDGMLKNLSLVELKDANQIAKVLSFATAPNSPLRKLLEMIDKETSLTRLPVSSEAVAAKVNAPALDSSVAKLMNATKELATGQTGEPLGKKVEDHFQDLSYLVRANPNGPMPLDSTMEALKLLFSDMMALNNSTGGSASAAPANTTAAETLAVQAGNLPEPLKAMMQSLATSSKQMIIDKSKTLLNQLWQREVWPLYQNIQGRYPFAKGSQAEVGLEDLSRLFAPGGALEQFQTKNASLISPATLAKLQSASKIKEVFFAMGSQKPSVGFSLKPLSLSPSASEFSLMIGSQESKITQNEPPVSTTFQWFGDNPSVSFHFATLDGNVLPPTTIDGQWALFRAVEKAHIHRSQDKFLLTFEANGLQAQYELSANSVDNPFSFAFRSLPFPKSL